MNLSLETPSYTLITGANTLIGRAFALELAKQKTNLLLIALPKEGLLDWAHQLMTYGVEVDIFETDLTDRQNVELLADWIHSSYKVSQFIDLSDMRWIGNVFEPVAA